MAPRSLRPAGGGRAGQKVDAREGAAAGLSREPGARDPAPAPTDGKGATGRERAGGGARGAQATQGEGAAAATAATGRGPGARGHRRGGRASEQSPSRETPVPRASQRPLISASPAFLPSNYTLRSGSPTQRLPIPENPGPVSSCAGLAHPHPAPRGIRGLPGAERWLAVRHGGSSPSPVGGGHWTHSCGARSGPDPEGQLLLSISRRIPPPHPSTHDPGPGHIILRDQTCSHHWLRHTGCPGVTHSTRGTDGHRAEIAAAVPVPRPPQPQKSPLTGVMAPSSPSQSPALLHTALPHQLLY